MNLQLYKLPFTPFPNHNSHAISHVGHEFLMNLSVMNRNHNDISGCTLHNIYGTFMQKSTISPDN